MPLQSNKLLPGRTFSLMWNNFGIIRWSRRQVVQTMRCLAICHSRRVRGVTNCYASDSSWCQCSRLSSVDSFRISLWPWFMLPSCHVQTTRVFVKWMCCSWNGCRFTVNRPNALLSTSKCLRTFTTMVNISSGDERMQPAAQSPNVFLCNWHSSLLDVCITLLSFGK